MISISLLTQQTLPAYLASAEYAEGPVVPIVPQRAESQLRNPRLHPDDVLLLLAHAPDGRLAGYLGALPDAVYTASGEARHCAWLSCMWVSPDHRGQRIAQQLLERAAAVWNHQLLITEYTAVAEQVYKKTGLYRDLTFQPGIRLYLRADLATLLPPKRPLFARVRPLLRLLDGATNAVLNLRYLSAGSPPVALVEYVTHVDAEAAQFIQGRQSRQLTRRGPAELNWLLQNPWMRSARVPDANDRRYEFSSVANLFRFEALKLRNAQGQLTAFLIFARRNQALKLPYCYHSGNLAEVAEVIYARLRRWRIATFTTFQPGLVEFLKTHTASPALHRRPMLRKYIAATGLTGLPDAFDFQDGDGDASFT